MSWGLICSSCLWVLRTLPYLLLPPSTRPDLCLTFHSSTSATLALRNQLAVDVVRPHFAPFHHLFTLEKNTLTVLALGSSSPRVLFGRVCSASGQQPGVWTRTDPVITQPSALLAISLQALRLYLPSYPAHTHFPPAFPHCSRGNNLPAYLSTLDPSASSRPRIPSAPLPLIPHHSFGSFCRISLTTTSHAAENLILWYRFLNQTNSAKDHVRLHCSRSPRHQQRRSSDERQLRGQLPGPRRSCSARHQRGQQDLVVSNKPFGSPFTLCSPRPF